MDATLHTWALGRMSLDEHHLHALTRPRSPEAGALGSAIRQRVEWLVGEQRSIARGVVERASRDQDALEVVRKEAETERTILVWFELVLLLPHLQQFPDTDRTGGPMNWIELVEARGSKRLTERAFAYLNHADDSMAGALAIAERNAPRFAASEKDPATTNELLLAQIRCMLAFSAVVEALGNPLTESVVVERLAAATKAFGKEIVALHKRVACEPEHPTLELGPLIEDPDAQDSYDDIPVPEWLWQPPVDA